MAASRLQRWAVFLLGYEFDIKYIKGENNGPADSLSRVIKNKENHSSNTEILEENEEYTYLNFIHEEAKLLDCKAIAEGTDKDPILQKVKKFVLDGWRNSEDNSILPYKRKQLELTIEGGCVMWGHRVCIPTNLRKQILSELHSIHLGIVKTKAVARSYVWWPGLDSDIEDLTKTCQLCLENADNPPRAMLNCWTWPVGPNYRIHADFCGPIEGHMYLVITDAHSKWLDIREMTNITAANTIKELREYFSSWGLPHCIVTDNGPTFTSFEFSQYLKQYAIKHTKTAPYHPASNGAAENAVRSFKAKFKIMLKSKLSRHEALNKYLFYYRATPHSTTGCSPAKLQIGRDFRTKLDALRPSIQENVLRSQESQTKNFGGNRVIEFEINAPVMAKNYGTNGEAWVKAQIIEKLSPVTYNVRTIYNDVWKRHIDQIRSCKTEWNEPNYNEAVKAASTISKNDLSNLNSESFHEVQRDDYVKDAIVSDKKCDQNVKNDKAAYPKKVELRRSLRIKNKFQTGFKNVVRASD